MINYIFLYFILYSILGWICEVTYCAIFDKKITNRGFLHGPYCPIYGCGAMIIIYVLIPFRENIVIVFLLGMILTSILEYVTSFILEKIFNTRWWEYSNKFCNINGRVCLLNSILFGILSVVTMYILHPFILNIIVKIPNIVVPIIAEVIMVIFTIDSVITVITLINLRQRLIKIKELKEDLDMKLSEITKVDLIPVVAEILQNQNRDIIAEKRYFETRLINAFPHINSVKFNTQFEEIKESIEKSKRIRKIKIKKMKKKFDNIVN